jgi:hypothetical protein
MFPVYGGQCLSRKAVQNWVANVSPMTKRLKRRGGSGWDNSQKTSMLRVSRHCKAMGQVYQCWGRICREINIFSRFKYRMFYVYIHLWPIYWPSLVIQKGPETIFLILSSEVLHETLKPVKAKVNINLPLCLINCRISPNIRRFLEKRGHLIFRPLTIHTMKTVMTGCNY